MKRKKDNENITKKGYWLILISACLLFILGFVFLFIAAFLQDNGFNNTLYTIIGFLCFPCFIGAIIILLSNLSKLISFESKSKLDKVDECNYTKVDNIKINDIIENINKLNFKSEFNYYYLKKFSFFKDFINYYIKIIDDICDEELENIINKETKYFDSLNIDRKNKCLMLIIEKDSIDEKLLETFSIGSKMMIMRDVAFQPLNDYDVLLISLYDKSSNTIYFMESSEFGFSVYKYGIKMLKKLINIK